MPHSYSVRHLLDEHRKLFASLGQRFGLLACILSPKFQETKMALLARESRIALEQLKERLERPASRPRPARRDAATNLMR
jgi:hypothetical protein